jgi:hypothetical protein
MPDSQQTQSEIPTLYINSARLAICLTDARLFLGESLPNTLPDDQQANPVNAKIVDRICIVLSPEILPQLVDGISKGIQSYESAFGKLRAMPQPPVLVVAETKKISTPNK